METKTPEKTFGNFFIPEESVPPLFISSIKLFKMLLKNLLVVCFSRTERARVRDRPAESIPLRLLVNIIFSDRETPPKISRLKENLNSFSLYSFTERGTDPLSLISLARANVSGASASPSTIDPSLFCSLYLNFISIRPHVGLVDSTSPTCGHIIPTPHEELLR